MTLNPKIVFLKDVKVKFTALNESLRQMEIGFIK